MDILRACLLFVGNSAAGGVTWDAIKKGGGYLVHKFWQRFGKFFLSQRDAERYLQMIAEKENYDEENPFRDAALIYKKSNQHGDTETFEKEFKRWCNLTE